MKDIEVMRVVVGGVSFDVRGDMTDEELAAMLAHGLQLPQPVRHLAVTHRDGSRSYIRATAAHLWMLHSLGATLWPAVHTSYARAAAAAVALLPLWFGRLGVARLLRRCVLQPQRGQCAQLWHAYADDASNPWLQYQCRDLPQHLCIDFVNHRESLQDASAVETLPWLALGAALVGWRRASCGATVMAFAMAAYVQSGVH
jgi:hypothetical protein